MPKPIPTQLVVTFSPEEMEAIHAAMQLEPAQITTIPWIRKTVIEMANARNNQANLNANSTT